MMTPQSSCVTASAGRAPRYLSADPVVNWWGLDRPLDWNAVFGRSARLAVEIGYGNGENLVRRALERPEVNFVGLELSWQSAKRALRRIAKSGASNIRLVDLDARTALERLFNQDSVASMEALFPIPWPKDKHEKRRLFSTDFLKLMNSRIVSGGAARIVTDFRPYADWMMEQVEGSGFRVGYSVVPPGFDTKYERKWREGGQDAFYVIDLVSVEPVDVPPVEDVSLFTAHLTGVDPDRTSPANLLGPVTVKFREHYYDPARRTLLWRAFIVEGDLVQDLWVKLAEEENGLWVLKSAPDSHVLPTRGVREALELVLSAALSAGASLRDRRDE